MMSNTVMRGPDQNSPKSSPRGSRSPAFMPRENTTGTLRTTITLGKIPSVSRPFYLMKDLPDHDNLTGSTNLIKHYGLENSYTKFSGKKVKEELSAFLPNLPGNIDSPSSADDSSLRALIEKPPICGKEILTFTSTQLSGFRLHPGPLPEKYRQMVHAVPLKKKKKKEKNKDRDDGAGSSAGASDSYSASKGAGGGSGPGSASAVSASGGGAGSMGAGSSNIGTPTGMPAANIQAGTSVATSIGAAAPVGMGGAVAPTGMGATGTGAGMVSHGPPPSAPTQITTANIDANLPHDRKHKRQRPRDEFEDKKKRKKKEKKKKKEKHHSPDHHSESSRDKFG